MPSVLRSPWSLPALTGLATVALIGAVLMRVDLTPRVEADFFFAPDDPQLQESQELDARYPRGDLLIVRAAAPDVDSDEYEDRVEALAGTLEAIPGVTRVFSVASENRRSPLWSRVLTPEPSGATNLILQVEDRDPAEMTRRLEAALTTHERDDFRLLASGVVVIVELIRQSLRHDLVMFSTTALLLFGLITTLVYRSGRVVIGTLASCLAACAATLLVTDSVGIGVGLLTANIITIVFVLTLSHTVFIAANWRRADGVETALRQTIHPSLWCMLTTVCGFLSLWLASAKPLQELGTAGAIGTLAALVSAFTVLPAWLAAGTPVRASGPVESRFVSALPTPPRRVLAVGAIAFVLVGLGTVKLNTDPTLLSYFAPGGAIRPGLETIDRAGGSTPLLLAVGNRDGSRMDNRDTYDRLWVFQDSLEADPSTGMVLSPAPFLAHARTFPLANLIPIPILLGFLDRPEFGGITEGFIQEDRTEVLFSVRMIEGDRREPREDIVDRLVGHADPAGLAVSTVGGLFELQGRLGALIASSLKVGLGGLLSLFLLISLMASRSVRTALGMLACLLTIPALVLGVFGHLGVAVDIITSPAANVALAMGVDSMIHLVTRVRRLGVGAARPGGPWLEARAQLAKPIAAACSIICVGFGIFALSEFPPTQRFGFAVILGTLSAGTAALIALPAMMKGTEAQEG